MTLKMLSKKEKLAVIPFALQMYNKVINYKVLCTGMPALSESNRIAREVYKAHLDEIKKRKGDIVVIDIAQKKVLDVINKDEALTLIQRTADALHRHIYLLNVNPDKPLVWAR